MISCIVINGIIFLIIFFKRSALCNGWMYMYDVVYIYNYIYNYIYIYSLVDHTLHFMQLEWRVWSLYIAI